MAVTYATRKSSSEKLHPFCYRPAPFSLFFFTTIPSEEEPGRLHSDDDVAFALLTSRLTTKIWLCDIIQREMACKIFAY